MSWPVYADAALANFLKTCDEISSGLKTLLSKLGHLNLILSPSLTRS